MSAKIKSGYIEFIAEIPQPIEREQRGLMKYGKDNLYPQFLNSLYYDNPIHQGIINQKVMFAIGDGLEGDESIIENSTSNYDLNEVVESVFMDLEINEGYYLLFKWSVMDSRWYVESIPFELIRPAEDLTYFAYSEDWATGSQSEEKTNYKEYRSFYHPTRDAAGEIIDKELLLYVRPNTKQIKIHGTKKLTTNIFPIPSYSGCIVSIMAGIEMDWFHYAESVNGWTSNTIVNFNNGVPPDEETRRDVEKNIRDGATDRTKKGGITILYNDGKERAADIVNMGGNGNDTKYLMTQEHVMQTIMIGHGVQNPALFGLEVAGKLGNNSDTITSYLRFMETYVKRRRNNALENITYGLNKLNGTQITLQFKEYIPSWVGEVSDIDNRVAEILNKMSPLLANSVIRNLTINEIRNIASLPPIAGGDTLNSAAPVEEAAPTQMAKEVSEKQIISMFLACGTDRDNFEVLQSREFKGQDEDSFLAEYQSFAGLSELQIKILDLIKTGNSYAAIRQALSVSTVRLGREILRLMAKGYISNWKITSLAERDMPNSTQIKVMYSYETRTDVPSAKQSRPFCDALIKARRMYTREEINVIGNAVDRDVWSYRGGWYHNPDTGKNTPSCRHFWKQNIVTNK